MPTNIFLAFSVAVVLLINPASSLAIGRRCVQPAELELPDLQLSQFDKMRLASNIKYAVDAYFGHWEGVPDLDMEKEFDSYLAAIANTDSRRKFDLYTLEFFSKFQNGHTKFTDSWLWSSSFEGTGLQVSFGGGQWIVQNSRRANVPPGSVITAVDNCPIDEFFSINKSYMSGSSIRSLQGRMFNTPYFFPRKFRLTLNDGSQVLVDRSVPGGNWRERSLSRKLPPDIYYYKISSFSSPDVEDAAIAFLSAHSDAEAIVLDVRGNSGGTTPSKLLSSVLTNSYRDWSQSSPVSFGLLRAYGEMASEVEKDASRDGELFGFLSGMQQYFSRPSITIQGRIIEPTGAVYQGRLIVLADSNCASACEDFVMPLKQTNRAMIIGETTFGSSGQPKFMRFNNGMSFSVGAKRMFFANGMPFEGVGIAPNYTVTPKAEDIRNNFDPALEKALELVVSIPRSSMPD